jgi:SET domain-containing protein
MKSLTFPHSHTYTRLKPSSIQGVGVFAIQNVKKGTYIFPDDNQNMRWIEAKKLKNLPRQLLKLYKDFAIVKNGKYGVPWSFDRLTPAWYLNHSDRPNVAIDRYYRFYAKRNIKSGEELTVDYSTYSDSPQNRTSRARIGYTAT